MRWMMRLAVSLVLIGFGVLVGWQIPRLSTQPSPEAVAEAPRPEKAEAPKSKPPAVARPQIDLIPAPLTPTSSSPGIPSPPPTMPVSPAVFSPAQGLSPPPVSPPTIPTALPGPKLTPLPAAPEGATVRYLNAQRFAVAYEVTKKGLSGLGKVELWLRDANGWSHVSTANAGHTLETDLPADGVYGTKVVPVSGQGVRGPEPAKDAEPDLWIVRDTKPPEVSLKVTPAVAEGGKPTAAPFVIELTVADVNLDPETVAVEVGSEQRPQTPLFSAKDLGKENIETKIGVFVPRKSAPDKAPTGLKVVLDWTPAADVPPLIHLSVTAKDRAGNRGGSVTKNIGTDLTEPAARVTGVVGLLRK